MRLKRFLVPAIFTVAGILCILVIAVLLVKQHNIQRVLRVEINGKSLNVEIADNDEKRRTGLMNRKSLDKNNGMFFIFQNEDIYPFWMKNTLISLDMIWINSDKEVVYIKENAPPCLSQTYCQTYEKRHLSWKQTAGL